MAITLSIKGADFTAEELRMVSGALRDTTALHARMAGDAERWIKGPKVAGRISSEQHRTANTLGALPTGHLAKAYQQIEGQSDATSARLVIPGGSRLAAAFGPVTIVPKNGKRFLTIAAHREAYGRRAGEFDDLFVMRVGPEKTPVLARRVSAGENFNLRSRTHQRRNAKRFTQAEVMYVLAAKADIPEDPTLIPFDELEEVAKMAAGDFIDDILEKSLAEGGAR